MIEFDRKKDAQNRGKHGMSLSEAADLDLDMSLIAEDELGSYGEARFIAIGPLRDRICVLVYAEHGADIRAISLRPATKQEVKLWRENI